MKLLNLRKEIKIKFTENNIPETDADFIIAEVLETSRTELVLIDEITEDQVQIINEKVEKRLSGVPIEKIFKKTYFFGLEFKVDDNVLSPRPESELLVEAALKYIKENNYKTVLDMCTGSGCLAISVKKNADVEVSAADISSKALTIAKHNAKQNEAAINFIKSNMFSEVEGKFDLIISNPPYIDSEEVKTLQKEVVDHDPKIALDGGEFGLKFYNIIHDNLRKYLNENGMLIIEIGEDQKELLISLFNDFNLIEAIVDYSGNDRILVFKR
jgi:release factor glutamine methyltransferase